MLFSSTTFLFAFLPIVLITYYIVPRITRNLVLFIFSLVFYAWGEPVYIVLMIASTIVAYITGLLADKQRKNAKKKKKQDYWQTNSVKTQKNTLRSSQ